jgi:hypothetical protein
MSHIDEVMEGFEHQAGGRRRHRSKEDAWLGEEPGSDEEQKQRRAKSYNKPIQFTAAATVRQGEDTRGEELLVGRPGLGARPGLGSADAASGAPQGGGEDREDEDDDDDAVSSHRQMLPQGFITRQEARRMRKQEEGEAAAAAKRRRLEGASHAAMDPSASRDAARVLAPDQMQRLQAVERGGKGIGLKLLLKMGFAGTLGKNGKGLARPIDVKVRTGRQGLQESGERTQQAIEDFPNE